MALVAIAMSLEPLPEAIDGLDADLCPPAEGIRDSTTFLVDTAKPAYADDARSPADLLKAIARDMGRGVELRVYTVGDDPDAPRRRIGRLCKPYDNAMLQIDQAKDRRDGLRDCDDLPAQLPNVTRNAASLFCQRRDTLAAVLDSVVDGVGSDPVAAAHLIEALEDTAIEFEERPASRRLIVYSDLLQHAHWYSHFDLGWRWWRFADFDALRSQGTSVPGIDRPRFPPELDVSVHHIAHEGLTDRPRQRRALREFWTAYFAPASAVFVDAPGTAAYRAIPLMGLDSDADQAAYALRQERERLALERQRLRLEADRLAELEASLVRPGESPADANAP